MQPTKVTFKQYFNESKAQLEKALDNTPIVEEQYNVKTYCRLVIGEDLDHKQTINLKPGHLLSVLWEYNNPKDPTPTGIKFLNVENLDQQSEFNLYWNSSKLSKWLSKNTK